MVWYKVETTWFGNKSSLYYVGFEPDDLVGTSPVEEIESELRSQSDRHDDHYRNGKNYTVTSVSRPSNAFIKKQCSDIDNEIAVLYRRRNQLMDYLFDIEYTEYVKTSPA